MKSLKVHAPFTSKELRIVNLVTETLRDCIKTGDLDSFREVLASHLMTANKVALEKKSGVGRRTLYDMMDPDKEFNPELSTVSAVIRSLSP
jgi:DNA-binding phage protein